MPDVTIALSADGFALTVPSTLEGRTHVVEVPADIHGLKIMRKILTERAKETRRELGNPASPTQAMVEQWLREEKRNREEARLRAEEEKEEKRSAERKTLLGDIDLGDLDI